MLLGRWPNLCTKAGSPLGAALAEGDAGVRKVLDAGAGAALGPAPPDSDGLAADPASSARRLVGGGAIVSHAVPPGPANRATSRSFSVCVQRQHEEAQYIENEGGVLVLCSFRMCDMVQNYTTTPSLSKILH